MGRVLGDPLFDLITEKRAYSKSYSACGDLGHWLIFMLGVRDEKIVNRTDDGGRSPWRMGQNISMLVYRVGAAWFHTGTLSIPAPGDLLVMTYTKEAAEKYQKDGTHICVVDEYTGQKLKSFDYGQWDAKQQRPSGKRVERKFTKPWVIDERRVMGWVNIAKLPYAESAIVPTDFHLGVLDENPYYEDTIWDPGEQYALT